MPQRQECRVGWGMVSHAAGLQGLQLFSCVSPVSSLCSPVGRHTVTATCWAGHGLPGMGSESLPSAHCPVSRALTCYLWGEASADPAVLSRLFPCPLADFGTHQLSASIHLFSVYQVLGSLVVKSTTSKDLDSNPSLASSKLCDLGQVTQTLCASVALSIKWG